ncbi:GspH/FimT family pseudopilin [Microbulbifer sp. 2201CG32-9]|uniref:GspH/FimT family pseudopilin n=1 Tax=Microbulbifer sp. 2201CG32-9 TaxID=3232309 RepID=UPI00345C3B90
MHTLRNLGAFTLVELIFSIAILAIVIALAAPSMSDLHRRHRNESTGRQLFDLISLGRGKAYGHGQVYTLCPSDDGQSCGDDWGRGAMLFVDSDSSGERATTEKIERVMSALPAGASLQWRSFSPKTFLQFRPDGLTSNQNGNFAYCPPDGKASHGWIIVLNATGRPYYGRDSDSDGIVETGSGKNLACGSVN